MPNNYLTRDKKTCDRKKLKSIRNKQSNKSFTSSINIDSFNSYFLNPCIYFLNLDGKIVYIGETISLMTRISQHVNEAAKVFNNFSFEPCSGSDKERKSIEAKLIRRHKPKYNVVHNKSKASEVVRE